MKTATNAIERINALREQMEVEITKLKAEFLQQLETAKTTFGTLKGLGVVIDETPFGEIVRGMMPEVPAVVSVKPNGGGTRTPSKELTEKILKICKSPMSQKAIETALGGTKVYSKLQTMVKKGGLKKVEKDGSITYKV